VYTPPGLAPLLPNSSTVRSGLTTSIGGRRVTTGSEASEGSAGCVVTVQVITVQASALGARVSAAVPAITAAARPLSTASLIVVFMVSPPVVSLAPSDGHMVARAAGDGTNGRGDQVADHSRPARGQVADRAAGR
jgi:hypothetical protein